MEFVPGTDGFYEENRIIRGKLPLTQRGSWLGVKEDPENEDNLSRPDSNAIDEEREHMFDKVVTPSDVGKLNRLVIPKQHAEKHFPLDSSSNEKGLLLNFEDGNGKPWRFRYSYWNSSQSYVMTKGWSRFVKDKKLDAGDLVSFLRSKDKLYIDWRRRRPIAAEPAAFSNIPWSPLQLQRPTPPLMYLQLPQLNNFNLFHHHHFPRRSSYGGGLCSDPSLIYVKSGGHQQVGMVQLQQPMAAAVFESVPVVPGRKAAAAAGKRLRLFGVNMECAISESDHDCDILSSTTISQPAQLPHLQLGLYNGTPVLPILPNNLLNKGKSSMSLDLDI